MVSMDGPCELELAIASEFDVQNVLELGGDTHAPDASVLEELPADCEPTFNEGAFGLVADVGRDRDEEDESDFDPEEFGDEPEEDDQADDFDDDEEDLDDDFDDFDDDEDV
jgi:hypothetical protein